MKLMQYAVALALLCTPAAFAKSKEDWNLPPVPANEPLAAAVPAYAQFQADINLINGGSIQGPKDIERALDKAANINRDALTRGLIAYEAMTAARNPAFVAGVRKTAAFYGRDKTINGLILVPKYAQSLEGGAAATASIARAAAADAARVLVAGESVKQRAREAQTLAWGKAESGAAAPRLKRLKGISSAAGAPAAPLSFAEKLKYTTGDPAVETNGFGGDAFWRNINAPADANLVSLPSGAVGASGPPVLYSQTSGGADIRGKIMSLAALYALNATAARPDDTERLMNDNITNGCLQGAQLQFYQCVASAKFNYENMACIGEAGLTTVGMCVKDISK